MAGMAEELTTAEPTVIADLDGTELATPDVSSLDNLQEALKSRGRATITGPAQEAPAPVPVAPKPAKRAVERVEETLKEMASDNEADPDEPKIEKPWARARILTKERNRERERADALEAQLRQMNERLAALAPQPQAPVEDDVDPHLDPVGAVVKGQEKILGRLENLEKTRKQESEVSAALAAIGSVNTALAEHSQSDPVFEGAVMHIAEIMYNAAEEKYPNKTEAERLAITTAAVNQTKLDWAKNGKDPVEEMYKMAIRLKFDPDAYEAAIAAEGGEETKAVPAKKVAAVKKPDAKAVVERAKQKQAAVATVGGAEGASPRANFQSELMQASKDPLKFDAMLKRLHESGQATLRNDTPGKTPSFAELMPGKGTRIS